MRQPRRGARKGDIAFDTAEALRNAGKIRVIWWDTREDPSYSTALLPPKASSTSKSLAELANGQALICEAGRMLSLLWALA